MKLFGIIYIAKNKINGRPYIGQTVQPLYHRKYNHLCEARRSRKRKTYFSNAILKYGINGFEWSIIHECYSREELNLKEEHYINIFDSRNNGYNLTNGGDGISGFKNPNASIRMKLHNPMYDKNLAKRIGVLNGQRRLGKTYEELYGTEKANEMKNKASMRMKINNPNKKHQSQ